MIVKVDAEFCHLGPMKKGFIILLQSTTKEDSIEPTEFPYIQVQMANKHRTEKWKSKEGEMPGETELCYDSGHIARSKD